jgi:hypothetical protein
MPGVSGIQASFKLAGPDETPAIVETDMSRWLKSIARSSDVDELDGTTFQAERRETIAGFDTVSLTLTGNWSKAAHDFLAPLGASKPTGLVYTHCPEGDAIGKVEITGDCNFLSYNGPSEVTVDGVTEFTVELAITSEAHTTIAALAATTVAREGRATKAAAAAR